MQIFAVAASSGDNRISFPSVITEEGVLNLPLAGAFLPDNGRFLVHGRVVNIGPNQHFVPGSTTPVADVPYFAQVAGFVNGGLVDGTGFSFRGGDGFISGLLVSAWGGELIVSGGVHQAVLNVDQLKPVAPEPALASSVDVPTSKPEAITPSATPLLVSPVLPSVSATAPAKPSSPVDSPVPQTSITTPSPAEPVTTPNGGGVHVNPTNDVLGQPKEQVSHPEVKLPITPTPAASNFAQETPGELPFIQSHGDSFVIVSQQAAAPFPVVNEAISILSSQPTPAKRGRPARATTPSAQYSAPVVSEKTKTATPTAADLPQTPSPSTNATDSVASSTPCATITRDDAEVF